MNFSLKQLLQFSDINFLKLSLSENKIGIKLLNKACELGNVEKINWLLDNEVDVNSLDGQEFPLRQAIRNFGKDNVETIQLLLNRGANVNLQNNIGGTALMNACCPYNISKHNNQIIKLLVDSGANINHNNNSRWASLRYICTNYKSDTSLAPESINLLLDHGAEITDDVYSTATSLAKEILDNYKSKMYFGVESKEKMDINFPDIIEKQKDGVYYYVCVMNMDKNSYSFSDTKTWDNQLAIFRSFKLGEPKIYKF